MMVAELNNSAALSGSSFELGTEVLPLKPCLYNPENHDCLTRKGGHPSYLLLIYIHT
jgi:hypothetical protein